VRSSQFNLIDKVHSKITIIISQEELAGPRLAAKLIQFRVAPVLVLDCLLLHDAMMENLKARNRDQDVRPIALRTLQFSPEARVTSSRRMQN
jgi:hypothetical protein